MIQLSRQQFNKQFYQTKTDQPREAYQYIDSQPRHRFFLCLILTASRVLSDFLSFSINPPRVTSSLQYIVPSVHTAAGAESNLHAEANMPQAKGILHVVCLWN